MEWHAFFGAIEHQYFEEVKEVLLSYPNEGYIISKEVSPDAHIETKGEHIHFLVNMKPDDYHKFAIRIFKKRFALRGRATEGAPRQYGKVKHIENLERMKAYTLKDGHFETNLSEDEIPKLQQLAKEEDKESVFKANLMKYLQANYTPTLYDSTDLYTCILEYFIAKGEGRDPSRAAVQRYCRIFITYFSSFSTEAKIQYLKLYLQ